MEPRFLSKYLKIEKVFIWDGIGTKSLPHQDDAENIMCVIKGSKTFYIASPFESNLVYAGLKKDYP